MRRTAPRVTRWVDLMNTPDPNSGRFLPDDEIPETLLPMLEVIFAECMPTLMEGMDANAAWMAANPDAQELPRGVGEHEFSIGGRRGRRMMRAFSQWMLQRPLASISRLQAGSANVPTGCWKRWAVMNACRSRSAGRLHDGTTGWCLTERLISVPGQARTGTIQINHGLIASVCHIGSGFGTVSIHGRRSPWPPLGLSGHPAKIR